MTDIAETFAPPSRSWPAVSLAPFTKREVFIVLLEASSMKSMEDWRDLSLEFFEVLNRACLAREASRGGVKALASALVSVVEQITSFRESTRGRPPPPGRPIRAGAFLLAIDFVGSNSRRLTTERPRLRDCVQRALEVPEQLADEIVDVLILCEESCAGP